MTSIIKRSIREGVPLIAGGAIWLCLGPSLLIGAGVYAPLLLIPVVLWVCAARNDYLRARLAGARAPTAHEHVVMAPALTIMCRAQHGPPLVTLVVRGADRQLVATAIGHRTVMAPSGLIDALAHGAIGPVEAAATLIHAAATVRSGRTRPRPLRALLRAPWLLPSRMCAAVARVWPPAHVIVTAWRGRAIPGVVASTNFVLSGHTVMAALTTLIIGLSYG
ncbi:hypothetical protein [Phycicoccus avicenniae]|uniref:hypothetical protein n=1 Tax=Phycicoccus avicenniae TaxID=2828860 RepID=UPI003D273E81